MSDKWQQLDGQLNLYQLMQWNESLRGHEADWLKANGYKNIYIEKPPAPGLYEWRDINQMKRVYNLRYSDGGVYMGSLGDFRAIWRRPLAAGEEVVSISR
jgi:uncharacterized protein YfaT (DUF1175 family)